MKRIVLSIVLTLFTSHSFAARISTENATIISVGVYGEGYEPLAGDILIAISSPATGCEKGYYIKNNSIGKDSLLSVALSAFHTGAKVGINAYDTPGWTVSGNYCLIESLRLMK